MWKETYFEMQETRLSLTIKLQHPLCRWWKVLMLFLPKEPQWVHKITWLRAIDSFNSELNLLRRIIISHRTMKIWEKKGNLSDQQWGVRQQKQFPGLSLQSELHLSLYAPTRNNGAVTDVNAPNWFDSIQPNLMSLSYCKVVTSPPSMHFLSKAILRCCYFPLTAHRALNMYISNLDTDHFCHWCYLPTSGSIMAYIGKWWNEDWHRDQKSKDIEI